MGQNKECRMFELLRQISCGVAFCVFAILFSGAMTVGWVAMIHWVVLPLGKWIVSR